MMSSASGNTARSDLLQSLKGAGEISFARFMSLALYGEGGYYASHVRIGLEAGDFYTASQSRLFARTVANVAVQYWQACGKPNVFQIIEFGGGTGEFAARLWSAVTAGLPDVAVTYHTVEVSDFLKKVQQERMAAVSIHAADALHLPPDPAVPGFLFGNEVLDALPVEYVQNRHGTWLQAYVRVTPDNSLEWVWHRAEPAVASFAQRFINCPEEGYAEVCLAYPAFFDQAFQMVGEGQLVLFDYGITTTEWQTGFRPQGTLRAFREHQLLHPLQSPGDSDLTADVNWDAAQTAAKGAGFQDVSVVAQGNYLVNQGIVEMATNIQEADPDSARQTINALKHLVLPGGMGERFSVLQGRKTRRTRC